jgi:hypothetical protein
MDEDLADLRWHYSGAYVINHPAPDVWVAQRTDDSTTLRAGTPDGLLDLIRVDYAENPCPGSEQLSGSVRPPGAGLNECLIIRAGIRQSQFRQRWLTAFPKDQIPVAAGHLPL